MTETDKKIGRYPPMLQAAFSWRQGKRPEMRLQMITNFVTIIKNTALINRKQGTGKVKNVIRGS